MTTTTLPQSLPAASPPDRLTTVLQRPATAPALPAAKLVDKHTATRSLLRASYAELYRLAEATLRSKRSHRVIDPRTLVNEAARHSLGASGSQDLADRAAYYAFLANALHRMLGDLLEEHQRSFGESPRLWLSVPGLKRGVSLVSLLVALRRLEERSERHAQTAVLRMLGGLSNEEVAEQLGVTPGRAHASFARVCDWFQRALAAEGLN